MSRNRLLSATMTLSVGILGIVGATTGTDSSPRSASAPQPAPSAAHSVPARPHSASAHSASTPRMPKYRSSDFAARAKALPSGLLTALGRDLGISGAEYLADAAASAKAVDVVAGLTAGGVHVLGSRMKGSALVVNVASAADVPAVTAVGATAVVGAPKQVKPATKYFTPATTAYGGEGYIWTDGIYDYQCSIGFNGYNTASGARQYASAGHCFTGATASNKIYLLNSSNPGTIDNVNITVGSQIGVPTSGSVRFGSGYDSGLVSLLSTVPSPASIATWDGGSTAAPLSSAPLPITGEKQAIVGDNLCKSGSRTGWTCGSVLRVNQTVQVEESGKILTINSILANTCILPGDSGGAAVVGSLAVGIDSTTSDGNSCAAADYQSGFFPMQAGTNPSVQKQFGTSWQLGVTVTPPAIVSPAANGTLATSDSMTGTLSGAGAGDTVSLYIDGSTTATATADASSGSWSIPLASVPAGHHSYGVAANSGTYTFSHSVQTTGAMTVLQGLTESRPTISGTPKFGVPLAANVASSPSGATFSYQWKVNGLNVGANQPTYVPVAADVGKTVTVSVVAALAPYPSTPTSTSAATAAVAPGVLTTSALTVTGLRNVNEKLTVAVPTWTPGTVAYSYQWLRNGVAISNATGSSYTQVSADNGTKVDVVVTGTESGYTSAVVRTTTTSVTAPPLLTVPTALTISGAASVGGVLGLSGNSWGPSGVVVSYQWDVGGKAVSGATGSTFVVPTTALGTIVSVRVTGKRSGYSTAVLTRQTAAPIALGVFTRKAAPKISGSFVVGAKLTATAGTWTPAPTFTYQWLRNGVAIAKATASTYIVTAADIPYTISVRVTARRTDYATVTLTSTGIVAPAQRIRS